MDKERLDKLIASTGKWSRREVKLLIRQGRVLVDGRPPASGEQRADPEAERITVDGADIGFRRTTWVMLNKPAGVLSATEDGRGATVLDLLPPELRRIGLFPVGRLDKDSQGLLLLTDDGGLAHQLLSPRYHVDKEYEVRTDGALTEEDAAAFRSGLTVGELRCLPAELVILESGPVSLAHVILREGKFHQVKRMLASRGKPVLSLRRVRMGKLPLDPLLHSGKWRFLTPQEVEVLQNVILNGQ